MPVSPPLRGGRERFLIEVRLHVLLGYGVGEEGTILVLGLEAGLESRPLRRIGQRRLSSLRRGFQCVLALDVFGVSCLGGVEQVDTELLLTARTSLEVQRLRFVKLALHAGKHTMQFNLSHNS